MKKLGRSQKKEKKHTKLPRCTNRWTTISKSTTQETRKYTGAASHKPKPRNVTTGTSQIQLNVAEVNKSVTRSATRTVRTKWQTQQPRHHRPSLHSGQIGKTPDTRTSCEIKKRKKKGDIRDYLKDAHAVTTNHVQRANCCGPVGMSAASLGAP